MGWWEFANAKALLKLEEAKKLHECLTEAEKRDAKRDFDNIDTDRSGKINQTEARNYFQNKFQRDVDNKMRTVENAARVNCQ